MSQAVRAAEPAVEVRELVGIDELAAAVALITDIWGRDAAQPVISLDLARALTHAGGYGAGAFVAGHMVAASIGFLGIANGEQILHSHVTGVMPTERSRNIGFALKQHQRTWALTRDIRTVTWTFDPLVRRNAFFNITRLGAGVAEYLENFYGPMNDELNRGDESDRLFARWRLDSPAATAAAARGSQGPDLGRLRKRGAVVLLDAHDERAPEATGVRGDIALCAVPEDIVSLRARHREAARAWRYALRATLGAALQDGYAVTGFAREGWYVLEKR